MLKLLILTTMMHISLQHLKNDLETLQSLGQKNDEHEHDHKHFNDKGEIDPALLDAKHEMEHIKSHLDVPIDPTTMTLDEMQFHFFRMHDDDRNRKLDGCELVKTLIHQHGEKENMVFSDEQIATLMDKVLAKVDFDMDGMISWTEFRLVGGSVNISD